MKADPNSVNRTYFHAEYTLRPVPQIEIRKYIGISSISQNRKKSTKSIALNTPSRLVSSSMIQAKYSLGRSSMRQEMSTATRNRKPVSTTSASDRPSTPTAYWRVKSTKSDPSQTWRSMNWKPPGPRS